MVHSQNRRTGAFPAGGVDSSSILSPRGSDSTGGLGVKMVEYVLGTSPTSKDSSLVSLEPRMRGLGLNDNSNDKDKDKAPSPFDPKECMRKDENGMVMQNGGGPMQNGVVQVLDDDKGFK